LLLADIDFPLQLWAAVRDSEPTLVPLARTLESSYFFHLSFLTFTPSIVLAMSIIKKSHFYLFFTKSLFVLSHSPLINCNFLQWKAQKHSCFRVQILIPWMQSLLWIETYLLQIWSHYTFVWWTLLVEVSTLWHIIYLSIHLSVIYLSIHLDLRAWNYQ
jgi:hypothetical protein